MKNFAKVTLRLAVLGLLAFSTRQVWAQSETPKVEFFGGYVHTNDAIADQGFAVSVTRNLNKHFGITAESSFSWGKTRFLVPTFDRLHSNYQTHLVGPKLALRTSKLTLFGQSLFGVMRTSGDYYYGIAPLPVGYVSRNADTSFAAAVGGGIDLNINDKFAVRALQVDALTSFYGSSVQCSPRFMTGVIFRLGKQ